jgi:hypothetical protein
MTERKIPERLAPPIEVILLDEISGRFAQIQEHFVRMVATQQVAEKLPITTAHYRYELFKCGTIYNDGPDDLYILSNTNPPSARDVEIGIGESYEFDYGENVPHTVWLVSNGAATVRIRQLR